MICFMQQQRFNQMSTTIIGRIDDMGGRIDELEKSISDLMQQVRTSLKINGIHIFYLYFHYRLV